MCIVWKFQVHLEMVGSPPARCFRVCIVVSYPDMAYVMISILSMLLSDSHHEELSFLFGLVQAAICSDKKNVMHQQTITGYGPGASIC